MEMRPIYSAEGLKTLQRQHSKVPLGTVSPAMDVESKVI